MNIQIRKAERMKAKLRLGIAGPSGAGKTMGALKIAKGITAPGGKIVLIDTERSSGDLYADLFDYDIIDLTPPYKPEKYVEAIQAAEAAGYDTIILDSLSHAWADEGGLLDQADKLGKQARNSYTVWADLTPQHRRLVNGMLNSTADIIATVRSKQAYELEEYTDSHGNKKSRPVKMGLAPVQREGMEYEFTVFFDVDQAHNARATKDRTNMFKDEVFPIDEGTGQRVRAWLNAGKDNPAHDPDLPKKRAIVAHLKGLGGKTDSQEAVAEAVKRLTQLDLAPEHYDEIGARLGVLVDERRKATDQATPESASNDLPVSNAA